MSALAIFDEVEVRRELKRAVERAGSQVAFAEKFKLSPCFVSHVLIGYQAPSKKICEALGFMPVRRYVKT